MEPHDSKTLNLSKAIRAHEEAQAALADLMHAAPEGRFEEMVERIRRNLEELRAESATAAPDT